MQPKKSLISKNINTTSILLVWLLSFVNTAAFSATKTPDETHQRIISLAPHITEMLYSIGVGDRIVATMSHSDFPEAAKKLPIVGNYARLNIEKIMAYEPDLIIAWKTGNPSDDLARLTTLGFTIVYSDPKTLTDVAKEIKHLGKYTATVKKAAFIAEQYQFELNALRATYSKKAPVNVFYELWSHPLTTISQNAWPQQHLNICGANNPFSKGLADYPQIGLEQVLAAKPQLIIQPISNGEPNKNTVNWRQWQNIPAVKHNQIIMPNSDTLHRMTPRLLPELKKLCEKIDETRQYYHHNKNYHHHKIN